MDKIYHEIDVDYIVRLLDYFVVYQQKHHLHENEKDAIIKFIYFIMKEGDNIADN